MNEKASANAALYKTDFHEWAVQTADFVRDGRIEDVDTEILWDEILAMAGRDERDLSSRMRVLTGHLLKWKYQPERRSKSWRATIRTQRVDIEDIFDQSPSLRNVAVVEFPRAYRRGRELALDETGLDPRQIPTEPPFTLEQALDETYFPD